MERLRRKGYALGRRNRELEAHILEAPDDPERYLVYGDWLAERGDPRAELIRLQVRNAHRSSAVFERRIARMLDEEAGRFVPLGTHRCLWRFGFIRSVRVESLGWTNDPALRERGKQALRDHLARFERHPSGFVLQAAQFHLAFADGSPGWTHTLQRVGDTFVVPIRT